MVAGDGGMNPYPELVDHVNAEGCVVVGQSGWTSGRAVRLVGCHLVFPST